MCSDGESHSSLFAVKTRTYEIFIARIRDRSRRFFSLISPEFLRALCARLRTHQRDGRVSVENRAAPLRNRFLMSLSCRTDAHHRPGPSAFLPTLSFPVNAPFAIVPFARNRYHLRKGAYFVPVSNALSRHETSCLSFPLRLGFRRLSFFCRSHRAPIRIVRRFVRARNLIRCRRSS